MNHTVLTFNGESYKAKFGLTVIGNTIKELGTDLSSFFNEFASNTPLVAPVLIFHSLKKGNPDKEFTLDMVEDLIDEDGGLGSPQLKKFLEGFTASIKVDVEPGKQKKPQGVKK